MNFLFFDIECANSYKYSSPICSFGYTLTDENFNVIKCEDLVMNPEAEFKDYLFQEGSACNLAYTQEYFLKQPAFPAFYNKIKKMLIDRNNIICGFSVENDINYLYQNCRRYKKYYIQFSGFDIQLLLKDKYEKQLNLQNAMTNLNIDSSEFTSHKSSDDAYMSMLVFKTYCEQNNLNPVKTAKNKQYKISLEEVIYKEKFRKYKDLYASKIKHLFERQPLGKQNHLYMPMINRGYDLEQVYNLLSYLYEKGCKLTRKETTGPILIYPNDASFPDEPLLPGLEMKHLSDILTEQELKKFPLKQQRKQIPDIDAKLTELFNTSPKKAAKNWEKEIEVYEEKECPSPVSQKLKGKIFRLTFSKRDNLGEALKVFKDVYNNGGYISKLKVQNCIFVKSNNEACPQWIPGNDMGITFMTVRQLYEILQLPEPKV